MMKKYLLIILLAFWCLGAGRMWDYGETDLYGIGNLTWVDQIDSKSSYNCSGALDWGAGDIIESFEHSEGNFCCADWTEDDGADKISTYDNTQSKHLSYSASIIHDADTPTNEFLDATLNSTQTARWFGWWFYAPDLDTGEVFDQFVRVVDDADSHTVIDLTLDDDADVQKLCFGSSDCTTDYFTLTAGAWWYIALHAQKNDTCTLKVYNSAGSQQNCTGSGDCNTNVMTTSGADDDIDYIRFIDKSSDSDPKTSYWDEVENSASELSP